MEKEIKLTLYTIEREQQELNALLEESGGEITPEIEERLAINEGNFLDKAQSYARTVLYYQSVSAAAKAEVDRINAIRKTSENIQARMKERILFAMHEFDKEKIEEGLLRLSIRHADSVIIDDEHLLPENCRVVKVEYVPDKAAIKEKIKNGEQVAGAHIETNESLQIR